jgi:hypothetical protein
MSIIQSTGKRILGANLRVVGLPLVFLGVLVFLIVFVVNTGFKKVSEVRAKLTESEKQEAVLTSKLETLQQGAEAYETFSDLSAVAIPEKNPAAVVSSQVKSLAATAGVVISKVSTHTRGDSESHLSELAVEISAQGELDSMLSYLDSLTSFLPLTEIASLGFSLVEDTLSTEAQITSFFAPFPESLPSLTSPISDLTQEEKDILGKFASYSQPTFTGTQISPGGPYQRTDIFNF